MLLTSVLGESGRLKLLSRALRRGSRVEHKDKFNEQ